LARYTVVISDATSHDSGLRKSGTYWWLAERFGAYAELGLYWFLSEYFGRSSVELIRPSQLLARSSTLQTDYLFVGLPTTVGKEHLKYVKFRQMALYDSTDFDGINFGESARTVLLEETNVCLKNWRDRRWKETVSIGLLPIKRPPLNNRLRLALNLASLKTRLGRDSNKIFDVGFVARPTGTIVTNQRLRWLLELKRDRPNLSLWGGLVGGEDWRQAFQTSIDAQTLEDCWLNRSKVGFFKYFAGLSQSKVALAPSGFAPWSYRHFEAIYAKCVVVSNDLRHYEFLVPFPRNGMVEVPDGESVVPAIDAALALYEHSPDIVEDNLQHLNRWIDSGKYSRKRPDTLDRFLEQLGTG